MNMAKTFTWPYSFETATLWDAKCDWAMELQRGGGLTFKCDDLIFDVDLNDIACVCYTEPGLFKVGDITLFDSDNDVLKYVCEGREIPLMIDIKNKDKKDLHIVLELFERNGFEVMKL